MDESQGYSWDDFKADQRKLRRTASTLEQLVERVFKVFQEMDGNEVASIISGILGTTITYHGDDVWGEQN